MLERLHSAVEESFHVIEDGFGSAFGQAPLELAEIRFVYLLGFNSSDHLVEALKPVFESLDQ